MRNFGNTLTRRSQMLTDKVLEVDDQIERLEDDIRKLKIEFDIYFNGGKKSPPHQARAALEARSNRLNGNRDLSFAQRYKLNNLISRYTAYRELWRRRLKTKGEEIY
ncbi:MAG: hypothetical protein HKN33_17405 [Pyrinomonadaceae bacterium]|nr:hypothetical protein [Pyrinomonadaceae bacterium]